MNVAIPHLNREVQKFINYDNSGPAASINSNVEDMLKWASFWLNKGIVGQDTLLSKSSYYFVVRF